jgi:ubiquinone/menaquinone biosynthesis C-methylase UbiE
MVYDVMDVRSMSYPDESFDLVIDKSTIDSLMCSDHPLLNVAKMLEEGYRVLRKGGYFLTISYSDSRLEHFLR